MQDDDGAIAPPLTDAQWERLTARAEPREIPAGEYLLRAGDLYPMALVEEGELELVRDAMYGIGEQVVVTFGPGSFTSIRNPIAPEPDSEIDRTLPSGGSFPLSRPHPPHRPRASTSTLCPGSVGK